MAPNSQMENLPDLESLPEMPQLQPKEIASTELLQMVETLGTDEVVGYHGNLRTLLEEIVKRLNQLSKAGKRNMELREKNNEKDTMTEENGKDEMKAETDRLKKEMNEIKNAFEGSAESKTKDKENDDEGKPNAETKALTDRLQREMREMKDKSNDDLRTVTDKSQKDTNEMNALAIQRQMAKMQLASNSKFRELDNKTDLLRKDLEDAMEVMMSTSDDMDDDMVLPDVNNVVKDMRQKIENMAENMKRNSLSPVTSEDMENDTGGPTKSAVSRPKHEDSMKEASSRTKDTEDFTDRSGVQRPNSNDTKNETDSSAKKKEDIKEKSATLRPKAKDARNETDGSQKKAEDIKDNQSEGIKNTMDRPEKHAEDIPNKSSGLLTKSEGTRNGTHSAQKETEDITRKSSAFRPKSMSMRNGTDTSSPRIGKRYPSESEESSSGSGSRNSRLSVTNMVDVMKQRGSARSARRSASRTVASAKSVELINEADRLQKVLDAIQKSVRDKLNAMKEENNRLQNDLSNMSEANLSKHEDMNEEVKRLLQQIVSQFGDMQDEMNCLREDMEHMVNSIGNVDIPDRPKPVRKETVPVDAGTVYSMQNMVEPEDTGMADKTNSEHETDGRLQKEIDDLKQLKEIDHFRLQKEIDDLKQLKEIDHFRLQKEIDDLKQLKEIDHFRLQKEIDDLKQHTELNELKQQEEIDRLKQQDEIDFLKEHIMAVKNEMDGFRRAMVVNLSKQKMSTDGGMSDMSVRGDRRNSIKGSNTQELTDESEAVLMSEIDRLQRELGSMQMKMMSKFRDVKGETELLHKEIKGIKKFNSAESMSEKLKSLLQQDGDSMKQSITNFQQNIVIVQGDLDRMGRWIESYGEDSANKERDIATLRKQLAIMERDAAAAGTRMCISCSQPRQPELSTDPWPSEFLPQRISLAPQRCLDRKSLPRTTSVPKLPSVFTPPPRKVTRVYLTDLVNAQRFPLASES